MNGRLLSVRDLSVAIPTQDGLVRAVRGVSLELARGEVLGIVGESGSGKTMTGLALLGLQPRSARVTGGVALSGRQLLGASSATLRRLRGREVVMIFQDPLSALNPVATVGAQLAEAYRAHHRVPHRAAWHEAVAALDRVGIPQAAVRAGSYPHEFSGGMRQRVVIAMAIINEPALIIADEPTSALDVTVQADVLATLLELTARVGAAMLLISHDLAVVARTADRVQVMYAGRIVEQGATREVIAHPRHPYTAGLLGSISPDAGGRLTAIPGAPPSMINLPPGCPFAPRCPLADAVCAQEPGLLDTDRPAHPSACHHWERLT
jgi:peptide/nickel transport system ATP-binding protein